MTHDRQATLNFILVACVEALLMVRGIAKGTYSVNARDKSSSKRVTLKGKQQTGDRQETSSITKVTEERTTN